MSKYLLYKPNKNCSKIPNGCHNIAFSLGGLFLLAHPVYVYNIYCTYVHVYIFIHVYIYRVGKKLAPYEKVQ